MNDTERITAAAHLQPTDRIPFALLSSGAWAINRKGVSLEQALNISAGEIADYLYEGYTLAGSEISWVGSGYNNIVVKAVGGKIKFRKKGTPDVIEPLLKSISDTDHIDPRHILDDPDIQLIHKTTAQLAEREQGQRLVGGSMWGPFTLAGLLYGADNLMRGIYKDRAGIGRLLEFAADLYIEYLRGYVLAGAKVVFMAEPSASGDMISRRHFEDVAYPAIRNIYKRLKDEFDGLILGLHICGNTTDRLDLIADSGADIMSLDYKVDLVTARDAFDGKIAFSGNLNPVAIVQNGTEELIRSETLKSMEEVGAGHSYIVMPGCDIPPSTPLENLQTISRTVREQGNALHS